ncbi:oxidative damage protection protein [Coxiella endosymbiont of Amblyomma nuttalli]|uniref:oxidative damage protection protein n=1 Tax=Coxiella endosymbiont of Amblyomma nuttalli TaxID=2749996 RepID=UPI001BAA0B48|nr:oxidative damage protection protein [Coxiella endosymbiont of Amblyomma nuttalli]QTS83929.1 putative Fe(2+)-trafficking protein [Coxiella endosymbiont of Amblyomma nuttalli]
MTRRVFCKKLGREAEGLTYHPYPGELGARIYAHISKQAWQAWLTHQTMLINEYRLNVIEPKSRQFLEEEMKKFLFGIESENYQS